MKRKKGKKKKHTESGQSFGKILRILSDNLTVKLPQRLQNELNKGSLGFSVLQPGGLLLEFSGFGVEIDIYGSKMRKSKGNNQRDQRNGSIEEKKKKEKKNLKPPHNLCANADQPAPAPPPIIFLQ